MKKLVNPADSEQSCACSCGAFRKAQRGPQSEAPSLLHECKDCDLGGYGGVSLLHYILCQWLFVKCPILMCMCGLPTIFFCSHLSQLEVAGLGVDEQHALGWTLLHVAAIRQLKSVRDKLSLTVFVTMVIKTEGVWVGG